MNTALSAQAIRERTASRRTAEVALDLVAAVGAAPANAPVSIRQVRHKFLFGCDAFLLLSRFNPRWYAAKPHYSASWGDPAAPFDWSPASRPERITKTVSAEARP